MPSCGVRQTIGSPLTVREANTNTSPSVVDFGARIVQSAFAPCVETWRTWKKELGKIFLVRDSINIFKDDVRV